MFQVCGCTLPCTRCGGVIQLNPTYGPLPKQPQLAVHLLTEEQRKQLRGVFQPHPWTPQDLDGVHA